MLSPVEMEIGLGAGVATVAKPAFDPLTNPLVNPSVDSSANSSVSFVEILWRQGPVRIEYQWIAPQRHEAPLIIFLHEGLGSLAMWKDFPAQLCDALGCRGLVWSRPGYGRSTPRAHAEVWQADFMHQQADEVLPALLENLGIRPDERFWLFGHSDGASIALLFAAHFAQRVAGAVVLAPHIFVEQVALKSIAQARTAYESTNLREKLARYHDDPDSAFWGWNRIWLDPSFADWDIQADVAAIRCPLLAIQGSQDEYGTMEQVLGVQRLVEGSNLLELNDCGHSPHRDQPDRVIAAVQNFFNGNQLFFSRR